jgi:hypothetical protein
MRLNAEARVALAASGEAARTGGSSTHKEAHEKWVLATRAARAAGDTKQARVAASYARIEWIAARFPGDTLTGFENGRTAGL